MQYVIKVFNKFIKKSNFGSKVGEEMERSTILGSFSVAGAAVEGVGEGGGMRCASATAPAVSSNPLASCQSPPAPRPNNTRPLSHRISCFHVSVLGEPILKQLKGTAHDFEKNSGD